MFLPQFRKKQTKKEAILFHQLLSKEKDNGFITIEYLITTCRNQPTACWTSGLVIFVQVVLIYAAGYCTNV